MEFLVAEPLVDEKVLHVGQDLLVELDLVPEDVELVVLLLETNVKTRV